MDFVQLRLLLIVIQRRYLLICTCAGLALALAIAYCVVATRIYEASGSLLVEYNREQVKQTSMEPGQQVRFDDVTTQTKVIQSPVLIDRALASLQPFQLDPVLVDLPTEDRRKVVERSLQVNAPRGTRIIHLSYRSPTPDAAVSLVQAITDAYLKFVNETYRTSAREVLEVMTKEKTDLEDQLRGIEEKVLILRQELGITVGDKVRTNILQKRMEWLQDELLKAQIKRLQADQACKQISSSDDNSGSLDLHTLRIAGNLGSAIISNQMGLETDSVKFWASTAHGNLIKDIVDLKRLSGVFGPNHPTIRNAQERIAAQKAFLANPNAARSDSTKTAHKMQMKQVTDWLKQELVSATSIEQDLKNKIEQEKDEAKKLNDKHLYLQTMETRQDQLTKLYDIVLRRVKELDIGENLSQINVTVVGHPTLLKNPVAPRITLIIFFSLCVGPVMGVALVVFLDRIDNKFYGPEDIQHMLGVPIIGNVPTFKPDLPCAPAMLMSQAADTHEAETFRSIRTWLFFAKDVHMFSVSSPLQSDGKSTVIANLATAVAQTGKRTLLIDGDLRRPRQHTQWSLSPSRGISYLLQKGLSSPEAITAEIRPSTVELLDILPVGSIPAHPAELLEKAELLEILQWAKTSYDYVLIDAPPLLPVADTGTIARLVDGMILVVNVRTNGRGAAYQAKDRIVSSGGTLLGVIANEISSKSRYSYSYGGYYRYQYSEGYRAKAEAPQIETENGLSEAA